MKITEEEKKEVEKHLMEFESVLKKRLSCQRKNIVEKIDEIREGNKHRGRKRTEAESIFMKKYLNNLIKETFNDNVIIEGYNKEKPTQFKEVFFGSKPAPDFIIEEPAKVVCEVKYSPLTTMKTATAVGQCLLYMAAKKDVTQKFYYGCIVFFDKSLKFEGLQPVESNFKDYLWDELNIFLIIL